MAIHHQQSSKPYIDFQTTTSIKKSKSKVESCFWEIKHKRLSIINKKTLTLGFGQQRNRRAGWLKVVDFRRTNGNGFLHSHNLGKLP